jgi:hypothetical protein
MARMRPLNRPAPLLQVQQMQTYAVATPRHTHTRPATCAEVLCDAHVKGWTSKVPTGSADEALLLKAAAGEIDGYRRHYKLVRVGQISVVIFPAGQTCLHVLRHRVSLERPAFFVVRGGDWRGSTGVIRRHFNGDQWVEDFAEHQDRLAHVLEGRP